MLFAGRVTARRNVFFGRGGVRPRAVLLALSLAMVWCGGGAGDHAWAANPDTSAGLSRLSTPQRDRAGLVELVSERTERSRTYLNGQRSRVVKVFAEPVNVRDAAGEWAAVNNSLRSTSAGLENGAAAYDLVLPRTLDAPVHVREGQSAMAFELLGGGGRPAAVKDNQATYGDVLPDVDAIYESTGAAIKETLMLNSSSVPSRYTYRLTPETGLTVRKTAANAVEFVDRQGSVAFAFTPPFLQDASGTSGGFSADAVSTDLRADRGGTYLLTVSIDRDWLNEPGRKFPVALDPTLEFGGADRDCYLVDATSANTNFCSYSTLNAGFDGAKRSRSLLYFNIAAYLPPQAQVLDAELGLYLGAKTSSAPTSIGVHGLTRTWVGGVTGATWNKSSAGSVWSTPGGDFLAAPSATANTGTSLGWVTWNPTELVRQWVASSTTNHGMLLKATNEATVNRLAFDSTYTKYKTPPYLAVTYEPGSGQLPSYDFGTAEPPNPGADDNDAPADSAARLDVNVANGNVMLREQDVDIAGRGPDVEVKRFYNNLDPNTTSTGGGWAIATGREVELAPLSDGSVIFYGPSAYAVTFRRSADGTFRSPEGVKSSLAFDGADRYTLKLLDTDEAYTFDRSGRLTSRIDPSGVALAFAYNGYGDLSSIVDADGNRTSVLQDSRGFLAQVIEPDGAKHVYTHDASGSLTSYTDPSGRRSTYSYDSRLNLVRLVDRSNNEHRISYDAANRATKVTKVTDAATGAGTTTTYTYDVPNRTSSVSDGAGSRTYFYDEELRVFGPDMEPPSVGPIDDGDGDAVLEDNVLHLNGSEDASVTVRANDRRSGVDRIQVADGQGAIVGAFASACKSIEPARGGVSNLCPRSFDGELPLATRNLPEGMSTLSLRSVDGAGNESAPQTIRVVIDRTPPPTPNDARVSSYDSTSNVLEVLWETADDPDIGQDNGAGVATSEVRYRLPGRLDYSSWSEDEADVLKLANVQHQAAIDVQLRSVDQVGNVSAVSTHQIVADAPEASSDQGTARLALDLTMIADDGSTLPASGTPVSLEGVNVDRQLETDAQGEVVFNQLPAGQYTVDPLADPGGTPPFTAQVADGSTTTQSATISAGYAPSDAETRFCATNASYCAGFRSDVGEAEDKAARLFTQPEPGSENTRTNAFKHAYWHALMVNTIAQNNLLDDDKFYKAREFGNAHEADSRSSSELGKRRATAMDDHNNAIGYQWGVRNSPGGSGNHNDEYFCWSIRSQVKRAKKGEFRGSRSSRMLGVPSMQIAYLRRTHKDDGQRVRILRNDEFSNGRACVEP